MSIKKTSLGNALESVSQLRADYDEVCKRLLGEKVVLASILEGCVSEFRGVTRDDIASRYIEGQPVIGAEAVNRDEGGPSMPLIQGSNTEDKTINEGTVYFDVLFNAVNPKHETMQLVVNAEAQKDATPGYPLIKRGVYYVARLISRQYGTVFTNSEYQHIRKVISIWLVFDPPVERRNSIACYQVQENMLYGKSCENVENYDLLTVIIINLDPTMKDQEAGLLNMLSILFSRKLRPEEKEKILEDEYQMPMTEEIKEKMSDMCNLSDAIWNEGVEQGIEKGRTQSALKTLQRYVRRNQPITQDVISDVADDNDMTVEKLRVLAHEQGIVLS